MRRAGTVLAAASAYLALSFVAWWRVWCGGVSHTVTARGWGDAAQQVWFVGWVPHALGAGINPFVSYAMFAPNGINLVANSSILFPAFVLSPITVLFGPLVAFNVGVLLAPAVSALAAHVVFTRYTTFRFGAWLGGLFYGFSPFVLNDLADGHLHVTLLVFPPLFLAVLDDLVVRKRGSAWSRGVLLGLLVTAQFLTSLELLAMVVIIAIAGLVVLAIAFRSEVRPRLPRVLTGLGVGVAVSAVLLAWPMWVLLRGPRRYRGTLFEKSPESFVAVLKRVVWPGSSVTPHVSPEYMGLLLLVIFAVALWRMRSGVLRFAAVLFVIALVLAMGRTIHITTHLNTHIPLPDRVIARVPLLENLLPVRFVVFCDLFAGLALAVALGGLRDWLAQRAASHSTATEPGAVAPGGAVTPSGAAEGGAAGVRAGTLRWHDRFMPAVAAGAVGVLALSWGALDTGWPYPARQVAVPAVYTSGAITRLPKNSVLLAYPVMNGFVADPMIWQADENMPYDMVAGYGFFPSPGPHPYGSLPASAMTDLFGYAQVGVLSASIAAKLEPGVRTQLQQLGVSTIVVLPTGAQPKALVASLRVITGRSPVMIDGAWVWLRLPTARPAPG